MCLLISHKLSTDAQRWLTTNRRSRKAKAVLALIRIQTMLSLSDYELIESVSCVIERELTLCDSDREGADIPPL